MKNGSFVIALFVLCLAVGCAEEDVLPAQQSKMASYLSGTHQPRLMTEQEAEASLETEPEFYTTVGNTAYRYIRHYYDPQRQDRALVDWGDRVSVTLWCYVFNYKDITFEYDRVIEMIERKRTIDLPYFTNEPRWGTILRAAGLDTEYWSFDRSTFRVGDGTTAPGLDQSLAGCRERDTVELYMTYTMANGDEMIGVVPYRSPVAWFVTVDEVEKTD